MSDITEGLDLLGDWLDAKGYTEEAGLCTRAMDEINALREECSNLKNELAKWLNYWRDKDVKALRAENARLRKALNPFAVVAEMTIGESEDDRDLFRPARNGPRLIVADFRKARAAMGESDE